MAETTLRVLLSDPLNAQGVEVFRRYPQLKVDVKTGLKPAELAEIIAPYHGLVGAQRDQVTREVIERADSLRVIGRAGVGVDNVDLEAATRRGIVVMNSPLGQQRHHRRACDLDDDGAGAAYSGRRRGGARGAMGYASKFIGIEVSQQDPGRDWVGQYRAHRRRARARA